MVTGTGTATASTLALALAVALAAASCNDRAPAAGSLGADAFPAPAGGSRIPALYVLVGPAGARAFDALPAETGGTPLPPGFGFAITGDRMISGRRYLQLRDGRWLAASEVVPAARSTFQGTAIAYGHGLRFGWVVPAEAVVRAAPSSAAAPLTTRLKRHRVTLVDNCASGWCPLAVGWLRTADLVIPRPEPRPRIAGPTDRWLDIDLASQTLVAYEGDRPVYATLVSTGLGDSGSPLATPTGLFSIQAKRELVRMDNLEHTGVVPYAYDVPLAQYFTPGKALHAALWHDRFGQPTTHGCVNLAPDDAEWLFDFTTARSPGNTRETGASVHRDGTLVRVRGQLSRPSPR